ncbi:hypothetical protein [Haloferula sp. BvORR071]|uniref:hypothetical protein n=1 Tax=Haloferula sp. BvORR071 TaxID=1396141 RepID=UPI00224104BA|nr:hypothetical protein [Haloferula sp. BvORR071]
MELSASETYTEALDYFHRDPEQSLMLAIRAGHDENIDCLGDHLMAQGAELSPEEETEDFFSKAVEGVSCTFGETATLLALEAGEAGALKECRAVLNDPELPASLKEDVRGRLMPRLQRHVDELERLRTAQAMESLMVQGA